MEHMDLDRSGERAVLEGQVGRVGAQHLRGWKALGRRLGAVLVEHRRREVDADHRPALAVQGERDPSGSDPDLQ
jgi:hypothetical protein